MSDNPADRASVVARFRIEGIGSTAFSIVLAVVAAIMLSLLVSILSLNHGTFVYTMDDPYIHLALSDQIRHGNYGVNEGLHAAPASSILYPFLLAAASGTSLHPYLPLILNSLALFATLAIFWRLFMHLRLAQDTFGIVAQAIILLLLAIDLNLIGVVFSGLEHSLHIASVAATVYGIVLFLDTDKIPAWLPAILILAPLLRYEGLALSLGAILILALRGRWRTALGSLVLIALFVGGFSAFLVSLGLPPLPSSVLSKSLIADHEVNGTGRGFLHLIGFNALRMALIPVGAVMLVIGGAALVFCLKNLPVRRRRWTSDALLALLLFTLIAAHAVAGQFGWLYRYEDYALVGTALMVICLKRQTVRDALANKKTRLLSFGGAAVFLSLICLPYIKSTRIVPLDSNNIYEQQFQMHRFVTDFYRAPVAVNDLGLVTYHNSSFVLDLGGLASEKGRALRSSHAHADDYRAFVGDSGARLVIIYREWFPGQIPNSWIRVASMDLSRVAVSSAEAEVQFYATDVTTADTVRSELESFSKTLPPGVKLTLYSHVAGSN